MLFFQVKHTSSKAKAFGNSTTSRCALKMRNRNHRLLSGWDAPRTARVVALATRPRPHLTQHYAHPVLQLLLLPVYYHSYTLHFYYWRLTLRTVNDILPYLRNLFLWLHNYITRNEFLVINLACVLLNYVYVMYTYSNRSM